MEAANARVRFSLLDRLTDYDPKNPVDPPPSWRRDLERLKEIVRHDISDLLNTRRRERQVPPEYELAWTSLLNYGLPDFTQYNVRDDIQKLRLKAAIEEAIRRFEPRLRDVTVSFPEQTAMSPAIAFRVSGALNVDPEPEPVAFVTRLDPEACRFLVMGEK